MNLYDYLDKEDALDDKAKRAKILRKVIRGDITTSITITPKLPESADYETLLRRAALNIKAPPPYDISPLTNREHKRTLARMADGGELDDDLLVKIKITSEVKPTIQADNAPVNAEGEPKAQDETTSIDGKAKPWDAVNPDDPAPIQPWFTPARYFARELVKKDSTLLIKRNTLAEKTSQSLINVGIYKRGGKKPLSAGTILKAFANINFS